MKLETHDERSISRFGPSEAERFSGTLGSETVERALRHFRRQGALVIEDIVDIPIIAAAREAFLQAYSQYLSDSKHEDALEVGDRRMLVTIRLDPPFDDPCLYANPYLLPVVSAALDDHFVLGAFGVVCSLPSAPAQHKHDDGGSTLFPQSGLTWVLPPAAITVGIPLLEMNGIHGTTALWLGSHRGPSAAEEAPIEPVVREGSCMLWDFRLKHGGTPNQSTLPRPLLYLTYCRPWFVEYMNFNARKNPKQKPLLATKAFLSGLSEKHQRLLRRAQEG
jgi:ectoine hydroxylase-related dioxygenase (phytanoyl-CoA dioxygenase family)